MENDQRTTNDVCRGCGCRQSAAAADARGLGLLDEFLAGIYTCCQVVQWADEQWRAWNDAAQADGKKVEEITKPLELEPDESVVPVRLRKKRPPAAANEFDD